MKIHHIAIWTFQLEEMKEFYTRYFNGSSNEKYINPKKGFESYFLHFDEGTDLELMSRTDIQNTPIEENRLGLTEPTSGSVEICGIDSTRHPIEVKRKIGYLPEDVGFYDDMTGPENLIYTARLNGISDAEAKVKALELMEHVGLAGQMKKKTGKYSRGMRQRLGLADVLIKNPEIIILDEPTSGIDPAGVQEFIELIRQLSRKEGLTVLFSSHHLDQVQKVCDRVGLFNSGKLVTLIDMSDLKDKHQELSDIYNHYMEEGGERHE